MSNRKLDVLKRRNAWHKNNKKGWRKIAKKGKDIKVGGSLSKNYYPTANKFYKSVVFPDIYKARIHCQIQMSLAGHHQYNLLFKASGHNAVGPGVTYDGFPTAMPSFTQNYYSNFAYLCSPAAPSGGAGAQVAARAPYQYYRILDSICKCRISSSNQSNAYGANAVLIPTVDPLGWTALAQTTLAEQDLAKTAMLVPNTTADVTHLTGAASTMKLFGLRYKSQMEDLGYSATAGADPSSIWYWMLDIQSFASDTNVAYEVVVDLYADIEFFGKNIQTSLLYES